MLNMEFAKESKKPLTILCLGAHSDDIEIGCGGTILKLLKGRRPMSVYWVVFSADATRKKEARASAKEFLKHAKDRKVIVKNFRDGYFPYVATTIKEYFETLKGTVSPDLIFTHYRHDLHQDHRLLSELTWNTFRNNMILEYECVKYDGDLGSPNFFVHLEEETCREKARHIAEHFGSQSGNHWFDVETFLSLPRIRGVESNAPAGYAEAFHCRKMVIG